MKRNRGYKKADELNEEEKAELKRLIGQMMWVTSQTRPDLSFETCIMSNAGKHPKMMTIHEANKTVRKLKSKSLQFYFTESENFRIATAVSFEINFERKVVKMALTCSRQI